MKTFSLTVRPAAKIGVDITAIARIRDGRSLEFVGRVDRMAKGMLSVAFPWSEHTPAELLSDADGPYLRYQLSGVVDGYKHVASWEIIDQTHPL